MRSDATRAIHLEPIENEICYRLVIHDMSAASIRRHAPGAGAGPDPRTPSQAPHLALVPAASPVSESSRPARNLQEAFCARLRSARERRGITLKAVADTTKVSASLYEALERGDISRWPKGIYRRAFFRSYAAAIGLPADSTVDEFLRHFPDEKPAPATPVRAEGDSAEAQAAFRLTLAPERHGLALRQRLSRATLIDAAAVLMVALTLAWWARLDASTTAAVVVLCYYPQLARLVRRQATAWRARPAAVRPEGRAEAGPCATAEAGPAVP